ncbi:Early growth response protein 1 C-terminal [Arabidopsis suecica]|uniref:Early growth response protein 1 C-terminal n=1 Tax=Arabidopsis suecica TaxID=45249 RepID=A0A8T1ZX35_ARASU|nr:Early growth response protein 1 C-terminal [Arabidopsis suecica]
MTSRVAWRLPGVFGSGRMTRGRARVPSEDGLGYPARTGSGTQRGRARVPSEDGLGYPARTGSGTQRGRARVPREDGLEYPERMGSGTRTGWQAGIVSASSGSVASAVGLGFVISTSGSSVVGVGFHPSFETEQNFNTSGYPASQLGYPVSQLGYPASQLGYPSPVTSGYPNPVVLGYPSPVTLGYPSPVTSGYPSPVTSGYPSSVALGYPSPSPRGYPNQSSQGTRAQSSWGTRAQSPRGTRAQSPRGTRAQLPWGTRAHHLGGTRTSHLRVPEPSRPGVPEPSHLGVPEPISSVPRLGLCITPSSCPDPNTPVVTRQPPSYPRRSHQSPRAGGGNPNPPNAQNPQANPTISATLAELKDMMVQLQKKTDDQEKTNKTLAQQIEEVASRGQHKTTRFQTRPLRARRDIPGINPTRLFTTPTDGTRTVARAEPARRENQDDPAEPNAADQTNEPGNPHCEQPRAGVNFAEQTDITDDEEIEENIRWAEESERERELGEIRASLAKAEADMKLVKSQMHSVSSSAPNIDRIFEESRNTPFTKRISEATISDLGKFKIESYNGTTDPKGHIKSFVISVARARFKPGEKDAGLCLLFVEHLKGPALDWFSRLDRNSIDSFDELSTLFLKQYSVLIDPGTSDADLWSLSQQPNEPLRDFLMTFKSTLAKVEGITDVAALSALKKALWYKSEFRKELNLSKPTTIRDALHRASDFVAHEEEMALLAKRHEPTKQASRAEETQTAPPIQNKTNQSGTYTHHEGHNFSGAHNYQVDAGRGRARGRERDSFTWTRSQPPGDKQEYCEHHKTFGHHTSRCRSLGAILAAKFLVGELGTNITLKDLEPEQVQPEQVDTTRGPEPREPEAPKRIRGTPDEEHDGTRQRIHTIMGGSAFCPDTVATIKAYQRRAEASSNWLRPFDQPNDVFMFEESETNGLDRPHNDPLVITLAIGDHDVSRVLIDTGSTINVIFYETLRQMNISMSQVNQTPRPVLGFSGETLMTLGTIQMPVQASGITKIVDFSVTDRPTIYNAIMGTPWLNLMRAVALTYHLCLKFSTPNGVKTIWGSQKNSRMCFMAAYKLRNLVAESKAEVNHKKAAVEKKALEAVLGTLAPPKATDEPEVEMTNPSPIAVTTGPEEAETISSPETLGKPSDPPAAQEPSLISAINSSYAFSCIKCMYRSHTWSNRATFTSATLTSWVNFGGDLPLRGLLRTSHLILPKRCEPSGMKHQECQLGYPVSQLGYPASQLGYPSPVTSGYPNPVVLGYPSPVTLGYPSPVTSGYPSPVTSGYPSSVALGYPSPSPRGYPNQSSQGTRAQSSWGTRAQSPRGTRAQSPRGTRAQLPWGTRAHHLGGTRTSHLRVPEPSRPGVPEPSHLGVPEPISSVPRLRLCITPSSCPDPNTPVVTRQPPSYPRRSHQSPRGEVLSHPRRKSSSSPEAKT